MKLNSEQIIKALECCVRGNCCYATCPYSDVGGDDITQCTSLMAKDALALIKELLEQIEILESLNRVNDNVGEDYANLHAAYTELARTCTTLVDKVKFWNEQYDTLHIRNAVLADAIENYQSEIMVTRGEVERLTEENEGLRAKVMALNHHADQADAVLYALQHLFDTRADAVREFAEKVIALFPCDKRFTTISRATIEQIAQEMLEGKCREQTLDPNKE